VVEVETRHLNVGILKKGEKTMDVLYKIVGIRAIGKRICLTVKHISEDKEFKTTKILGNLGGFMDELKQDAVSSRNPDQVSITFDEFKNNKYSIGDVISISINKGDIENG